MAAAAILILYRRMHHLLLDQGFILFMTFETGLLDRDTARLVWITSPHQRRS
jgi:hypothetical protein